MIIDELTERQSRLEELPMTMKDVGPPVNGQRFLQAVHSQEFVSGLTHDFYRYPARYSPLFAREAIRLFTKPRDLVIDPFMGGGTTLVEAAHLRRQVIGVDISSLAVFLARVKTTVMSQSEIEVIRLWADGFAERLNLRNAPVRPTEWIERGYQRNLQTRTTWPIRKTLELALAYVEELPQSNQRNFVRCLLLKTGQWALDSRKQLPSAEEFRAQLRVHLAEMIQGVQELRERTKLDPALLDRKDIICLNRSAAGLELEPRLPRQIAPKLILTSPPYPGVHVLYHRWQVQGRRETPAPFWLANCVDGQGESFYTFGHRNEQNLKRYFRNALSAFKSLAKLSNPDTLMVQMVGFSDRKWQLPAYLRAMETAGFTEVKFEHLSNADDGRLWRVVPNRKWYADQRGETESSKEVVLFHRISRKAASNVADNQGKSSQKVR